MDGTNKLIVMAVVGILLAAAIIGGVSALKLPSGTSATTITTSIVSTSTSIFTSTKTSTSTEISISNSTIPKGTLSTQIADLLSLPIGVTHVYISYSDIEVHTGAGNESVWYTAVPAGAIDLSSLAAQSLTEGVSRIPAGLYDLARFSLNSVNVTYGGNNISAIVPLSPVTVPILESGLQLQANGTSGLVLDIAPSVIPSQSLTGVQMQVVPYAKAIPIPSTVPYVEYSTIGAKISLESQPWFTSTNVDLADNLTVLTALVTSNALVLVVKNSGNFNVTVTGLSILAVNVSSPQLETQTTVETITTVITITQTTANPNAAAAGALPAKDTENLGGGQSSNSAQANAGTLSSSNGVDSSGYQTVASFLVLNNKEIVQSSSLQNEPQLGLQLAPGENASLTFIGKITTLDSINAPYNPLQITPGSQYLLQVEGPFGQSEDVNISAISPFG